jgi:hypothetical protein
MVAECGIDKHSVSEEHGHQSEKRRSPIGPVIPGVLVYLLIATPGVVLVVSGHAGLGGVVILICGLWVASSVAGTTGGTSTEPFARRVGVIDNEKRDAGGERY